MEGDNPRVSLIGPLCAVSLRLNKFDSKDISTILRCMKALQIYEQNVFSHLCKLALPISSSFNAKGFSFFRERESLTPVFFFKIFRTPSPPSLTSAFTITPSSPTSPPRVSPPRFCQWTLPCPCTHSPSASSLALQVDCCCFCSYGS